MLFVMLDHNDIVRNVKLMNDVFKPLTFHVAAYLVLPFLMPPKRLAVGMARDHAIRYLVPFLFALVGYALTYHIVYKGTMPDIQWLKNLGLAFLFADPWSLQLSTGFIVLWFLPALLSTVLLAALFNSSPPWAKTVLIVIAVVAHLSVGASPLALKEAVPQGLLIAFYILPFGIVVRYSMPWLLARPAQAWIAVVCLVVLAATWVFELGAEIEIGTLELPTFSQPLWVIASDLGNLTALAALLICSPFLRYVPGLGLLGKHSLLVYLFHPLLYKPIFGVLLRYCRLDELATPIGTAIYWIGAVVSVLLAASLSICGAVVIRKSPWLKAMITPRTLRDWPPSALLGGAWSGRS